MKTNESEFRKRPACALKQTPAPEVIACPGCRDDLEIWSDEDETICGSCGEKVSRSKRD